MTLITGYKGWIGHKLSQRVGSFFGIDVREGMNLLTCELPGDIEIIYHLAAQSSVESSWHDPLHDLDNIRMTARLVHAYPEAKIIYTNSAAALDQSSPYGFSKWAAAEYIKKFHKNYVICTLPNVYGEGSRSVVDIFKERNTVTIYGDGKQKRDYVYVSDIVSALVKARHWPVGEYQLGSGISTTVLELAEGKNAFHAEARREARESLLKNTTPDWQPTMSIKEYMKL